MRSVLPMKIAKIFNIMMSICFCVFGIIVIASPEIPTKAVGMVIGICLICFGLFKMLGFFSKDLFRLAFEFDLQLGIFFVVLGVAMLTHFEQTLSLICVIFGIAILSESIFKATIAFDAKKFGIKHWFVILLGSILTCAFGAILVFFPSIRIRVLQILLGLALLLYGLLNLLVILETVKIVKNQQRG